MDPVKSFLARQVWVGGLLLNGSDVIYVTDDGQEHHCVCLPFKTF